MARSCLLIFVTGWWRSWRPVSRVARRPGSLEELLGGGDPSRHFFSIR